MKRILFACLLLALSAFGDPIGYVINFSGQFGTLNLATGAFTPRGPGVPFNAAGGLAGAPGGPYYGVDSSGFLIRFTPDGTVTTVGDTGTGAAVGPNGISVIGGLTNGSVFALDYSNNLFGVNTATGGLSPAGALGLPAQEPIYDGNMVTSFNGDGTHLYYTLEISGGPNAIGPTLFQIDPMTLQINSMALTGLGSRIIGSGFLGAALYAFTDAGEIYDINVLTGAATLYSTYDPGIPSGQPGPPFTGVFGVVATPEPTSVWLSGGGVACLMLARGRRRKRGLVKRA